MGDEDRRRGCEDTEFRGGGVTKTASEVSVEDQE
jgi:hypothetical protein